MRNAHISEMRSNQFAYTYLCSRAASDPLPSRVLEMAGIHWGPAQYKIITIIK